MELKPISFCGHICHVILGLLLLILASLSFSTNWWIVYFFDCANDDFSYYLVLDKGLCADTKSGQEGNYEDCESWENLADNDNLDSDAQDDAQKYVDSDGLAKAGLALTAIFFVLTVLQMVPFIAKFSLFRYIEAAILGFVSLLFVAAMGNASNTYWTDQDNYPARYICNSYATSLATGYASAIVVFILSGCTLMSVLFPCCSCVDLDPPADEQAQSPPAAKDQATIANPMMA